MMPGGTDSLSYEALLNWGSRMNVWEGVPEELEAYLYSDSFQPIREFLQPGTYIVTVSIQNVVLKRGQHDNPRP